MKGIRVGIIGTGNIGCDLGERLLLDSDFDLIAIIGRNPESAGLSRFKNKVPIILSEGQKSLQEVVRGLDIVFDATSAHDSPGHWDISKKAGKCFVDLTPSGVGRPMVPELMNLVESMTLQKSNAVNYSMITCGGQSGSPVLFAITQNCTGVSEVEISSSIASKSAGPATRNNIDQYVDTTENLLAEISGSKQAKAMLVLNPAEPPVMMRTTITVAAENCDLKKIEKDTSELVNKIREYVPGYDLVVAPHLLANNTISATVRITGAGYYLPSYAGNLDIINAAAVETARRHFQFMKSWSRN